MLCVCVFVCGWPNRGIGSTPHFVGQKGVQYVAVEPYSSKHVVYKYSRVKVDLVAVNMFF